jgi:hypothetical protein
MDERERTYPTHMPTRLAGSESEHEDSKTHASVAASYLTTCTPSESLTPGPSPGSHRTGQQQQCQSISCASLSLPRTFHRKRTLMTRPAPSGNSKGWLRSRLESNLEPSLRSVPV